MESLGKREQPTSHSRVLFSLSGSGWKTFICKRRKDVYFAKKAQQPMCGTSVWRVSGRSGIARGDLRKLPSTLRSLNCMPARHSTGSSWAECLCQQRSSPKSLARKEHANTPLHEGPRCLENNPESCSSPAAVAHARALLSIHGIKKRHAVLNLLVPTKGCVINLATAASLHPATIKALSGPRLTACQQPRRCCCR